jgi:hypothetical protein
MIHSTCYQRVNNNSCYVSGRVKYAKEADENIKFDRFQVCLDDKFIVYYDAKLCETPRIIGSLNSQYEYNANIKVGYGTKIWSLHRI